MSSEVDDLLLAQLLAAEGGAAGAPAGIPRRPEPAVAPLSFAQQRLWFLDRLLPGNPAYNVSAAFVLSGSLNVEVLTRSVRAVAARHESLRTVFGEDAGGKPLQRILPVAADHPPVEWVDLQTAPDADGEARRTAEAAAGQPFDLGRGPLLRVKILRLAATRHAVVCTLHHIISDGWSTTVLIREIGAHYAAFAAGRAPGLLPLALQYGDFSAWQRSPAREGEIGRQLAFWRTRLAGLPVLELPVDRLRPAVQGFTGVRVPLVTSAAVRSALAALARAEGTTLFVVTLAAYQVALAAWSGQRDFAVGSPVAGRTRGEVEPLIGFFVNTLVLRAELSGNPRFSGVLAAARRTVQEALSHQDVPFERLVEALNPERELAHTPLVQAVFTLEAAADGGLALPGLALTPIEPEAATVKFDVTLGLTDTPDGLRGSVDFSADLFAAETAVRFTRRFESLLAAIARDPDVRLSHLLAPQPDEQVLLRAMGAGEVRAGVAALVPGRIAAHAALHPDAAAVIEAGAVTSFGEMVKTAGALAAELRRRGAGPESVVAVCMERSAALIMAQLATWQVGAAYLPLDPSHPPGRLAGMLADAHVRIVVTTEALRASVAGTGVEILTWEQRPAEGGLEPVAVEPEQTAYVIYTSGSTGRPKGVAVSHRALGNLVDWHGAAFGVTPADRATAVAGVGFDASVWEVWPALAAGASVVVAARAHILSPETLRDWLLASRATIAFVPTPLAEPLLALAWPEGTPLRRLLTGGDRLQRPPPAGLPFALINNYGPTEYAVVATSGPVEPADVMHAPDIGRPVANTRALVLDEQMALVPPGAVGELFLGGPSLARGYLHRPDLTADRFVPDPFGAAGERLYRTGDQVRWRTDGTLEFRGRADGQVKVRGQRIELGEIESVLRVQPGVAAAVVVLRLVGGAPALAAYVVPVSGAMLDLERLRETLRSQLSAAMVPASWTVLSALPVTPNGKVDRRALPEPAAPATVGGGVDPATPLERTIATVWSEALGRERVGVTDNFFDLGGHSLLLVAVQNRLQAVLGRPVAIMDLFAHPSVRTLAARLGDGAGAATVTPGAVPAGLSPAERAARQREASARRRSAGGRTP